MVNSEQDQRSGLQLLGVHLLIGALQALPGAIEKGIRVTMEGKGIGVSREGRPPH